MLARSLCLALVFAIISLAPPAFADDKPTPPNIVFILADDLGWGDLSCYGSQVLKTPQLDALAASGTLFTQFYVSASVCSPSRAAFMTGRFPAELSIHTAIASHAQNAQRGMVNWLDPKLATLPRLLQQRGYTTAHFGKWHLGMGKGAPLPSEYGFDVVRALNAEGPTFEGQDDPYFRARSTELMVDDAMSFMRTNADRPFFVQIWTQIPHATLHPTEEQLAPFRRLNPAKVPYTAARAVYNASVTDLDRQIGRLTKALDRFQLRDKTLVVFSSDNGPEDIAARNASHSGVGSPGPFRGRKRSLYEGGIRVPFLVSYPGVVPAGRVDNEALLAGVDLFPTICGLIGAEIPADVDGVDASAALRGEAFERLRPLFWNWRFRISGHTWNISPMIAMRDGPWKLLINADRSRVELYDIPRDPMELNNLASEQPERVEQMAKEALSWAASLPEGPSDPNAGDNSYPWPK